MTIPVVRQRAKHVKTRTGCRICRIRRIKCDEERPACRKCTSTGRECSGYEIGLAYLRENLVMRVRELRPQGNGVLPSKDIPSSLSVLPSGLSPMQAQAFSFFREHPLNPFPGYTSTGTWETIAIQLSHTEPALMSAIISVGAMYSLRMKGPKGLTMSDYAPEQFRFATKHYSLAMHHVQQCIASNRQQNTRDSVEIILLACLLFICVELFQGNNSIALEHLHTGLKILDEHMHGPTTKDRHQRRIILQANPQSTLELLSEVLLSLDCGAATVFGRKQPLLVLSFGTGSVNNPCPIPKAFPNLKDARLHLEALTSAISATHGQLLHFAEKELMASKDTEALDNDQLQCLVAAHSRLVDLKKNPQLRRHIDSLEQSVAAWSSALASLPPSATREEQQVRLLLEIRYFELWLTSSTWLDRYERLCDRFNENYSGMLSRIERYLGGTAQLADDLAQSYTGELQHTFTLSHGFLIPLLGIAARCRDTHVRRRALRISSRLHIQDGVVDSDFCAAIVGRLVDMEEDTARGMQGFGPGRPLTAQEVPEAARFMHANISARDGPKDIARVVCCYWAEPSDTELTLKEYDFPLSILEGAFPKHERLGNETFKSA